MPEEGNTLEAAANFLLLEWFEADTYFLLASEKIFADEQAVCDVLGIAHSPHLFDEPPELDSGQVRKLRDAYPVMDADAAGFCTLRRAGFLDRLPYAIHTNREFELMRNGLKPLATFSEYAATDQSWMEAIFAKFRPLIASSRCVARHYTRLGTDAGDAACVLLIARAAEEWRIDAYIELWDRADRAGWNDAFERQQGALLGYEDWQTDAFLKARPKTWA